MIRNEIKCEKSPNQKHQWEKVEDKPLPDGRTDWGLVPGNYCVHCSERKMKMTKSEFFLFAYLETFGLKLNLKHSQRKDILKSQYDNRQPRNFRFRSLAGTVESETGKIRKMEVKIKKSSPLSLIKGGEYDYKIIMKDREVGVISFPYFLGF